VGMAAPAPASVPKSLDAYLPASIRGSPALMAQARTPRTGAMAAGAGALPDDFDLGSAALPPEGGSKGPSPPPLPLAAEPAPASPGRKTSLVVNYSLGGPGAVGGCESLGMIDPAGGGTVRPIAAHAVPLLSSPAGK
jgi:hypothetical protein